MKFDRWNNSEGRTLAFRLFERDHSKLNTIYWYSVSEKEYFDHCYREARKKGFKSSHKILNLKENAPNVCKIHDDIEKWGLNRKINSNWLRLNSLLSVYSYFELYLNRVTLAAQESDPGLFLGSPKIIDGVKILKINNWEKANLKDYSILITKGTWTQRLNNIEQMFFIELPFSKSKILELDKSRLLRNSIAHYFGRDMENSSILDFTKQKEISLSEKILIKYFELLYKVAEEIDSKLLTNIGDYEVIRFFNSAFKENVLITDIECKKIINEQEFWSSKGQVYCHELIEYYNNV